MGWLGGKERETGSGRLRLHNAEIVEVRSWDEIQSTLDENGAFEGVPFMPEMRKYCGKRFRVNKRADKICVEGAYIRRMRDAVFLENVACDGADHDGCKRMCPVFWKEAWLRRSKLTATHALMLPPTGLSSSFPVDPEKTYSCQSTELVKGTEHLSAWDPRQYIRDLIYGNFSVREIAQYMYYFVMNRAYYYSGKTEYGKPLGENTTTPAEELGLQPGEVVEVRSREEIIETLDRSGRNRGLSIDLEMLEFCGKRYSVLMRCDRIILEKTAKMREVRNTVILNDMPCSGMCRRGCTRGSLPMWREIWLKRISPLPGQR